MSGSIVYETSSSLNHYQVIDMVYDGRKARVLFSGQQQAAQSGIALDGEPDLLFDYNQRFMELLEATRPKQVLLIGGGACTLPIAALAAFPEMMFTVVEPDEVLPRIAKDYFNAPIGSEQLQIVRATGREFVDFATQTYDAILLDAFSHTAVPRSLVTYEAVQAYCRLLRPQGYLGVNIISAFYGRHAELLKWQYAAAKQAFLKVTVFPASRSLLSFYMPQNFVMLAQNQPQAIELRYRKMPVDELEDSEPLRDTDI